MSESEARPGDEGKALTGPALKSQWDENAPEKVFYKTFNVGGSGGIFTRARRGEGEGGFSPSKKNEAGHKEGYTTVVNGFYDDGRRAFIPPAMPAAGRAKGGAGALPPPF